MAEPIIIPLQIYNSSFGNVGHYYLSLTICGMPYSLNICFVRSTTTLLVFWCLGIFLTKETLEKKSVIIGYSSSST